MKKEINTEININATTEKVWSIFNDFKNYPEWNPFIRSVEGKIEVGSILSVKLQAEGSKPMLMKPRVIELIENKVFAWKGKLFIKGLFDGEHRFELKDLGNGQTKFLHTEKFSGVLVRFFRKLLDGPTTQGFNNMNKKLKLLCETL